MSDLIVRAELLKTYGIDYKHLPMIPRPNFMKKNVIVYIVRFVLKLTVIISVVDLIFSFIAIIFPGLMQLGERKITPFAKERLRETEKIVQRMAAKVGITNAKKIKVGIDSKGIAAAAGISLILVSPEFIIRQEDLPEELKLAHLDNQMMTEEAWALRFAKWKEEKVFLENSKNPKSQLKVDKMIADGKFLLKRWRNQNDYNQMEKAILAHELGHLKHGHHFKDALACFGWDLLALPTLGISTLFKDKVLYSLKRKQEFEADISSLSFTGSPNGLIKPFKEYIKRGKILHKKYPQFFDKNGDNRKDHEHPPLRARIAKLKAKEA